MDDGEAALVARARDGDTAAFHHLVRTHARPLYQVCYRITADAGLAEDAVQEALLKAWRRLPDFDGRSLFSTWLHRIAVNSALDHRRRHARTGAAGLEPETCDSLPAAEPNPEQAAYHRGIGMAAQAALAALSEMERTAFTLRHHHGVPIAEISVVLGVAEGACRQAVFRAVRKLRAALEPHVMSHE